jgi:hypothetical protein
MSSSFNWLVVYVEWIEATRNYFKFDFGACILPYIYIDLDVAADNVECANFFFILIFNTRITINMQYYNSKLVERKHGWQQTWCFTSSPFVWYVIKLPVLLFNYLLFCAFLFPLIIMFFIFDNLIYKKMKVVFEYFVFWVMC